MFKGVRYVVRENANNLYRIYSIAKYELLADMRDSKLGMFWNFANPAIQVATYWFVFGFVFNRDQVDGIDFLSWMLGGMVIWFFISPCITNGCNAIYQKINIITKMKFPVSILPATVVLKEAFNHVCLMIIVVVLFAINGHYPSWHWFGLLYYFVCSVLFSISLSLTTSVLNMLARDTRKLILACMRLLMYLTPILWDIKSLPHVFQVIMKVNPIYYLVCGYRDCFFYHEGIMFYWKQMIVFWGWTILLFWIGSAIMYKFRTKFMDLI